jgi:predicted aconitase with swiveling domain
MTETTELILKGHKVAKGKAEGEALVTRDAIAFFGGVNTETGVVTDNGHEIDGVCVTGKVLLFPQEKGSAGASFQMYEMMVCQTQPAAIINIRAGSTVAVGAIVSNIPMMDRVEPDPYESIQTGDWVSLDADAGVIKVTKRKSD